MAYQVQLKELPALRCSEESEELRFFSKEEINEITIAETHKHIIKEYLE